MGGTGAISDSKLTIGVAAHGQERYFDAGLRHMLKQAMGEEKDLDSGLLHLQQRAWNALAELELYLRGEQNSQNVGQQLRPGESASVASFVAQDFDELD